MKTEIVVARYKENLDWLKKIKKSKDIKITIYNKGPDDIENIPSGTSIIKLSNIGRESHTYLYHIINNYDNLADQTIFCQGDSIFHSPDFLDLINKYRTKFEPVQPLTAWYSDTIDRQLELPPKPVVEATKNLWIDGKARIHVEYMDNNFTPMYPYFYTDIMVIKLVEKFKSVYGIENALKFNVERFRLKNVDLDYLFPVSYAAIFAVNKEAIRDNSVDFYNNIMSILLYDIRPGIFDKPMDQGLFLERLWLSVFNYKKYNKNYIPLKVKDHKLENYTITAKNNICNFSYFNIYCNLYVTALLDNLEYSLFISKYLIYMKNLKTNNTLYKYDAKHDKKIETILKNKTDYKIVVELNNNILKMSVNNNKLIEFNFNIIKVKHNKLNKVIVYDIAEYNKLKI
jgi:hypothetical protein